MLEDVLATLLARVLGTFVSGIDGKSLNLSVWRGEVRLSGLQLRRSALEALNLPARVIRGDVGEVVVRVPWRSLGRDPLVVALHNTTLLLAPADTTAVDARAEAEQDMPAKQEALAAWEAVEQGREAAAEATETLTQRIASKLLSTLEVRATNLHVALVDGSGPDAICAGFVLHSLSATTTAADAAAAVAAARVEGGGTDPAVRARLLARLVQKTVRIDGLAAYLNPGNGSHAGGLSAGPDFDATEAAAAATCGDDDDHSLSEPSAAQKQTDDLLFGLLTVPEGCYLLAPLRAEAAVLIDIGGGEACDLLEAPQLDVRLRVEQAASLTLSRPQLLAALRLSENLERQQRRARFRACDRPAESAGAAPRAWWRYALRALGEERRTSRLCLSTAGLAARREARLAYTEAYLCCASEEPESLLTPRPTGRTR